MTADTTQPPGPGAGDALMSITCPRCSQTVEVVFYGPCADCCAQLRATMGGEAHDMEDVAYEPKMNVTPNHLATKDD